MQLSAIRFKYISIFLLMLCGILSCRKKETDAPQQELGFFSLGEVKDYLLFKPGTSWIYRNSNNEIDSMVLLSCKLDTIHGESNIRKFDYENISYVIKSYRDFATYQIFFRGLNPDVIDFVRGWRFECIRKGGYYTNYDSNPYGYSCQFYYPFDLGDYSNGVYNTTFLEEMDSIIVVGKKYLNVATFSVSGDNGFLYPNVFIGYHGNSSYYWAKDFGMIKIEIKGLDMNNNEIDMNWELIASRIIR